MSESSLDEFRNYDPSKEMDIDALRTAVRGHLADDEWVMIHPKAILHILNSMEAAEKDAARYRWLRHGEISKLPHSDWGDGLVYDEREALDAHIDSAMASK